LKEQIENLVNKLTAAQRELFDRNIALWEKTAELNGRQQHFDSFEVDESMLMQEWYYLLEDINAIEFDPGIIRPASKAEDSNPIQLNPNSAISPKLRFEILERDGFRCQLCGTTAQHRARLEIDHKVPKKLGGSDKPENLWTLCFSCNRGKCTKII
jgi:hypothetical protein